jgi:hypothetical protein
MTNGRFVPTAIILLILFCVSISCTTPAKKRANSAFTPPPEASANYNRQIELNGFLLYQFQKAVESSLGPPFQTMEKESSKFELHKIDREAYMVFEYSKKMPCNIQSIQLTGRTNNMSPFNGLMLGDNKEKVIRILGGSFTITQIDQPKVQRYDYQNANYSVEIDAEGKLFSIRIHADRGLLYPITSTTSTKLPWDDFKTSVLKKDIKEILSYFRPDIEIYRGDKTLFIKKRFTDFLENPDSDIYEALLGEENSVYSEIQQTEPEGELRLIVGLGGGWVYKFYNGKILKEIVFFPYDRKYRVYEIAFRAKSNREIIELKVDLKKEREFQEAVDQGHQPGD